MSENVMHFDIGICFYFFFISLPPYFCNGQHFRDYKVRVYSDRITIRERKEKREKQEKFSISFGAPPV